MRLAALAALPLVMLVASAAAEEPAATHDLHLWKRTWTAGAARTVVADAKMTGLVRAESIDQATGQPQSFEQNLLKEEAYTYVQRCEAADAAGQATSFRVHVVAWRMQDEEGAADETLSGAHLAVTVKDGVWSWKHLNAAEEPSRLAKKWLDQRFGSEREGEDGLDLSRLGTPKGPVKVGDTWAGNVKFLDDGMPLALERSQVELSLGGVAGGVATMPVRVRLQLQGFPLGEGSAPTLVPWTEGGALEGEGQTRVALAPGAHEGGSSFAGALKGRAETEGLTVTLTAEMRGQAEIRAGGEIPEMQPVDPKFKTQPVR